MSRYNKRRDLDKPVKERIFLGLIVVIAIIVVVGFMYWQNMHKTDRIEVLSDRIESYSNGDTIYKPDMEELSYDEEQKTIYYKNLLTVYLLSDLDTDSANVLAESVGGTVVGDISGSMNILQILVEDTDLAGLNAHAIALMKFDEVIYAGYEYPLLISDMSSDKNPWSSNGEIIADKGNENNPGGDDWWAEAINAYSAWNYVDTYSDELSPVTIGIIDSGFEEHEDLNGKINFLEDYRENTVSDHGMNIAGIISADNNSIGIRGIADGTDVICADYTPDDSVNLISSMEYTEIIKQMIERDVKVINNSWGNTLSSETKYMLDYYWDEAGYFVQITNSNIRLRDDNGEEEEYVFQGNNRENIAFYMNRSEVSFETFNENVEQNSTISLVTVGDTVSEAYLLKDNYGYFIEQLDIKLSGKYNDYVEMMRNESERTGMDCLLMINQLIMHGEEDFLIVQSSGNGYDNGGLAVDASYSGYFCGMNENLYNQIDLVLRVGFAKDGITYNSIRDHVLIVGAVDNSTDDNGNYQISSFSNFGENVDIYAPGRDIFSTTTNNSYTVCGFGTSLSAPMVSGAAALLWQIDADLTTEEVRLALLENSGSAAEVRDGAVNKYPMLNIGKAVKRVVNRNVETAYSSKLSELISEYGTFKKDQNGTMSGTMLTQDDKWFQDSGVISATILDFDSDLIDEMLVCIAEPCNHIDENSVYADPAHIIMYMFDYKNGEALQTDSMLLGAYIQSEGEQKAEQVEVSLYSNYPVEGMVAVNYIQDNGKGYILCENFGRIRVFGDGLHRSYWMLEYVMISFDLYVLLRRPMAEAVDLKILVMYSRMAYV